MDHIDPPAIVQQVQDIQQTRRIIDRIIALQDTIDHSAYDQGIYLSKLQSSGRWKDFGSVSWKQFVPEIIGISYETARRRIRASQWHTEFGIPLADLYNIDYMRMNDLLDVPQDAEQAREIVAKLADGASVSDILIHYGFAGEGGAQGGDIPPSVHIYACKHCGQDNEVQI